MRIVTTTQELHLLRLDHLADLRDWIESQTTTCALTLDNIVDLAEAGASMIIALNKKRMLGFMILVPRWSADLEHRTCQELNFMYVSEEFRREGVGAKLLERLADMPTFLYVGQQNTAARTMYAAVGFVEKATLPNAYAVVKYTDEYSHDTMLYPDHVLLANFDVSDPLKLGVQRLVKVSVDAFNEFIGARE